jgi:2',3'-cyclic-nucleotide 2'-phosphodiesterase/3'-nucleotidase
LIFCTGAPQASPLPCPRKPDRLRFILESPDKSRQVILRYINERQELDPRPNNNWELILPRGSGPLLFQSSPDANNPDALPPGLSFVRMADSGFAVYRMEP